MFAQSTSRDAKWEFVDLLSRDDELMRAEFEEIVSAQWAPSRPRVADGPVPGPNTDPTVPPKGPAAPIPALREQRSRQHGRERSPPELPGD